jgi:hydroxymethylbilane synthase
VAKAEWLRSALLERFSGISVELSIIKTQGDKILDVPLAKVGGKGLSSRRSKKPFERAGWM